MTINTQIFCFNTALIVEKIKKLGKLFGFNAAVKPEFEKNFEKFFIYFDYFLLWIFRNDLYFNTTKYIY